MRKATSLPGPAGAEFTVRAITGDTWTEATAGITVPYIFSFALNTEGDIFASTDFGGGVFRSTDNGESWEAVNDGLTTSNGINALTVTPAGDLFAGTYGDGILSIHR